MWDLIENTVTRAELRTVLATVDDLMPPSDAELEGSRAEEPWCSCLLVRCPPRRSRPDRRAWLRLAFPADRPEETVDRAAYTLCQLEQFHRHLEHRSPP
ncbi:hypothetical protein ACWCPQ_08410 [Nocardia sp. NPDC001965]